MMFVAWMLAQAVAAAPQSEATPTLQAQFEQATEALDAHKDAEALAGLKSIEARHDIGVRTRSVVLMREGSALIGLGRDSEALVAYQTGLAQAPASDSSLTDDRLTAWLGLGGIGKANYDYVAARHAFEQARTLATEPASKLQALLALTSVTMFDDNDAALGAIDEALQVASTAKLDLSAQATIHDLRGRVLLNRGDKKGALAEFLIALKDQGGLTERTDLRDVKVRADVALAYILDKNPERALDYFAMTGEGRLPEGPFAVAARMDLPPCGGDVHPEDDAVIEFGIGSDGTVIYADPIYASRPGPMAREMARAVSGWAWRPAEAAKIPPFYRAVTRIQLRCSNAAVRPADLALLLPDVARWLAAAGSTVGYDALDGKGRPADLRQAIERADKGAPAKPAEKIGWLTALAMAPETSFDDRRKLLQRATSLAQAEQAPPAVEVFLKLSAAQISAWQDRHDKSSYMIAVRQMLRQPDVAADPHSSAVLRLIIGSPGGRSYDSDAETALRQVIDDTRLEARDPLKVGAWMRLASYQAVKGDLEAARASYLKTGLSAQQCSLVDAKPAIAKQGVGSDDYPVDMVKMRVSGWTRIEFDILPSGGTTNRRAVLSFPPYVFGDSTAKAMSKTRYTQTYRPDGDLGCGGASSQFHYLMPQ